MEWIAGHGAALEHPGYRITRIRSLKVAQLVGISEPGAIGDMGVQNLDTNLLGLSR